jgi:predicted ATPase/serine phosphatase RsbU (regulator of sigma subunit)/tRNA A-37 threonylcarbamoyl transferase component Bud32
MPSAVITVPGVRIERPLHESPRTIVYRATGLEDGRLVAVKCSRSEYPSAQEVARYRNEFEVTRQIDSPSVIRADRLGASGGRAYLVSPYFDGVPLGRLAGESTPLTELLPLMIQAVRALADIHQAGVLHKDLSPANILVDHGLRAMRIIDFDIASRLLSEQQEAVAPSVLEGTLRYISPEQTGRMNRTIDYRTDFYSLGAIFYELLAGTPVFEATDATELVHHHLAKRPFFSLEVRRRIPLAVRDVVLKLLAKTPEERYQSAAGIARDLERCLQQLCDSGDIDPFTPGEDDVSDRFVVAQRLYGREAESALLLDAFAQVSAGQKRVVLISGPSGIGKSALVREVHKPILEKQGYFGSGKADELRRNVPYAALSQALREVAQQMLSEDDGARERWRRDILESVGPNVRLLVDLVPELSALTGPLPPVPDVDVGEAHNRLGETFRKLIQLLANARHPLVLFLDDLQWMDRAALNLLRTLLLDRTVGHLLLIAAFRDSEVGPAHPLALTIDQVRQAEFSVQDLVLKPLGEEDVQALVADSLPSRQQPVDPLAALIHQRTEGNAFYVNEYLHHLHREGLIAFQRNGGVWTWDLPAIQERGVSDSLVELVRAKILKTPPDTRQALQIGASLGSRFELGTLSAVMGEPPSGLARALLPALREGIVTLVGAAYQLMETEGDQAPEVAGAAVSFRFVHDRVRQGAYALVDEANRRQVHHRIARVLLAGDQSGQQPGEQPDNVVADDQLFDIVEHLNQAWDLIDSAQERVVGLRLNLRAARRAKLNGAFEVALRCLRHAMANLPPDSWDQQPALTRDLHLERAECEYAAGQREVVDTIISEALAHLSAPMDRAPFYGVAIRLRTNQGRPREAIALGAEALSQFGIQLPVAPEPEVVNQAILDTRARLSSMNRQSLIELPTLVDPEKLALLRLLNRLGPPTYFSDPGLYALMHCIVVGVSLANGHASESVRGYSVYGMILVRHDQRFQEGRRYGELAIDLADRLDSMHMKGVSRVLFGCFIGHWTRPAEESLGLLDDAYRYLREAGDIVLASFALCFHASTQFNLGSPLGRVQAAAEEYLGYLRGVAYRDMGAFMECLRQVGRALAGETTGPTQLDQPANAERDEPGYDEAAARQLMAGLSIKTSLHFYLVAKLQLHYLFGELDAAAELIPEAEALLPLSWGALNDAEQVLYTGLISLALADREPKGSPARAQRREAAAQAQELLSTWAVSSPENFWAKHLLLEAEAARVDGQPGPAVELFDQALEAARERQNLQMEALAAELAGRYHHRLGRRLIAGAYLKHAHYAYVRWGAVAKANELARRHPQLLAPDGGVRRSAGDAPDSSRGSRLESLNVAAITKATRAIAEEIVLERLVTKFMRILVENAGAQAGYLIFPRPEGLQLGVRAHIDDPAGATTIDEPLEGNRNVIPAVVNQVASSQQHLVHEDVGRVPELMRDQATAERAPRSVLCFPVIHLGRLSCIVYLENNLAPGVFTAEHVEMLRMLSAQAAISIENANLYAGLQEKIVQLEQVQRQAAERERLKKEMEIAEGIQTGILPRSLAVDGLDIAASMLPADAVGGDYYDVVPTAGGCWIGMGDVAGHGLESGLSMLMLQSAIAALVRRSPEAAPHELLRVANEVMYESVRSRLQRDEHATLVLLRYELGGRVWFAGAHEDILVCRSNGHCDVIETPGPWVGATKHLPASTSTSSLLLEPGDVMLLFTDGIIEARDQARQQFGIDRLRTELERVHDRPAEEIREHLMRVLRRFAPTLEDDVTLLVARYLGPGALN